MNTDLIAYYRERAREYEKVYFKPERQESIAEAEKIIQKRFAGKKVLEMACGTGFWTEKIARTANSIHALDINENVIALAKEKQYHGCNMSFEVADLFSFTGQEPYEAVFAGFIWSHVPLQELELFLRKVKEVVQPNGTVLFIDNNYIPGNNSPITETDTQGNTYQTRKLENGSTHVVLKNFPTEAFIKEKFALISSKPDFLNLNYFWTVCTDGPTSLELPHSQT